MTNMLSFVIPIILGFIGFVTLLLFFKFLSLHEQKRVWKRLGLTKGLQGEALSDISGTYPGNAMINGKIWLVFAQNYDDFILSGKVIEVVQPFEVSIRPWGIFADRFTIRALFVKEKK